MKKCNICGEVKTNDEFCKNIHKKDKLHANCKKCECLKAKIYREKNKEKIKEKQKEYREKNKEMIKQKRQENKEKMNQYINENKERLKEQKKEYRENNKDKTRKWARDYYKEKKESLLKRGKEWRNSNPDKIYYYRIKRRSYKNNVQFTLVQRSELLERDNYTCQQCGVKVHDRRTGDWNDEFKAHIDHIIPISRNGDSTPENLQILCRTCNLSKSDKILK